MIKCFFQFNSLFEGTYMHQALFQSLYRELKLELGLLVISPAFSLLPAQHINNKKNF
jgi:hypothetical protein